MRYNLIVVEESEGKSQSNKMQRKSDYYGKECGPMC